MTRGGWLFLWYVFTLTFLALSFSAELKDEKISEYKKSLKNYQKVKDLYRMRNNKPIWNKYLMEEFKSLIELSKFEGLNPEDYKFELTGDAIKDELTLTDKLISLSYDLYYGRVDPSRVYKKWSIPKKRDRVPEMLAEVIEKGNFVSLIEALSPKYKVYSELKGFLKEYYRIWEGGGWPFIKYKGVLRKGMTDPSVAQLRRRLYITGDLGKFSPSEIFDEELEEAVKKFQRRHGLLEDGVVGMKTLKELNLSVDERIEDIRLNLEKFRWMPESLGEEFLLVNIPSFDLYLIKEGKEVLYSKVIVGKYYKRFHRPTPMLYSKIDTIVINPYWYVPKGIAVEDLLPKIKKDPYYLRREGIKVYLGGVEVDPLSIEWGGISQENFNFRFVQQPGEKNALGRIKFYFPNPFDVYLHDTPHKELFKEEKRAFSSGCIRVEKAFELASYLLGSEWDEGRLRNTIEAGETVYLKPPKSMPIYIFYFTAFVKNSELYFWDDLYGYDRIIKKLMNGG